VSFTVEAPDRIEDLDMVARVDVNLPYMRVTSAAIPGVPGARRIVIPHELRRPCTFADQVFIELCAPKEVRRVCKAYMRQFPTHRHTVGRMRDEGTSHVVVVAKFTRAHRGRPLDDGDHAEGLDTFAVRVPGGEHYVVRNVEIGFRWMYVHPTDMCSFGVPHAKMKRIGYTSLPIATITRLYPYRTADEDHMFGVKRVGFSAMLESTKINPECMASYSELPDHLKLGEAREFIHGFQWVLDVTWRAHNDHPDHVTMIRRAIKGAISMKYGTCEC
jgi:hypothetical protein